MAKKQQTLPDDVKMYSGLVRLYGGPKQTKPLEDMMIERFPATSEANARAFLIQAGRKWLEDGGYHDIGGIHIVSCTVDGEPAAAAAPTPIANARKQQGGKAAAHTPPPATVYRPFKCPISSLCDLRYVGRYDYTADTILIVKQESKV